MIVISHYFSDMHNCKKEEEEEEEYPCLSATLQYGVLSEDSFE
jgi:hypothetical protein